MKTFIVQVTASREIQVTVGTVRTADLECDAHRRACEDARHVAKKQLARAGSAWSQDLTVTASRLKK